MLLLGFLLNLGEVSVSISNVSERLRFSFLFFHVPISFPEEYFLTYHLKKFKSKCSNPYVGWKRLEKNFCKLSLKSPALRVYRVFQRKCESYSTHIDTLDIKTYLPKYEDYKLIASFESKYFLLLLKKPQKRPIKSTK